MIRNFQPSDLEEVSRIHEASQLDYKCPDLNSPLFLVKKVYADAEGKIRVLLGARIETEFYLMMDHSAWTDPETKHQIIHDLQNEVLLDLDMNGVEDCVLYLPPNMERFGQRLVDDFGWSRPRAGWLAFSRSTRN